MKKLFLLFIIIIFFFALVGTISIKETNDFLNRPSIADQYDKGGK